MWALTQYYKHTSKQVFGVDTSRRWYLKPLSLKLETEPLLKLSKLLKLIIETIVELVDIGIAISICLLRLLLFRIVCSYRTEPPWTILQVCLLLISYDRPAYQILIVVSIVSIKTWHGANYEFNQVKVIFTARIKFFCLLQIKAVVLFIYVLTNHISLIPRW